MVAALYVRVSSKEQEQNGLSVDDQITSLQIYCDTNNIEIYDIYNDAGVSGHIACRKRPELMRMLRDAEKNKFNLILFTKLDRYFRKVPDYHMCQQILDAHHIQWRAIREDYDSFSAAGRLLINMKLSVAEHEAEMDSERESDIIRYKRARGEYVGNPPLGYRLENKHLAIDPETKPETELMFETYLRTWSSRRTSEIMREHGYILGHQSVRKNVKNPIYAGDYIGFECPSYITKAQHQAIITHCQKHTIRNRTGRDYIFTGLVVCGMCGSRMQIVTKTNEGHSYYSYRCERNAIHDKFFSISEKKLESMVISQVRARFDGEHMSDYSEEGYTVNAEAEIKKLRAKLERVGVRYEEGDLTTEEYKEKRKDILSQIDYYENQYEPVRIEIPDNWLDVYNDISKEAKRAFWRSFIKEIKVIPGEPKTIEICYL